MSEIAGSLGLLCFLSIMVLAFFAGQWHYNRDYPKVLVERTFPENKDIPLPDGYVGPEGLFREKLDMYDKLVDASRAYIEACLLYTSPSPRD